MQPFEKRSKSVEDAAIRLVETIPRIMGLMRDEIRKHRPTELSEAQFRILVFLGRADGISLSELADDLGTGLPTVSKLIDGLVTRNLVNREVCPEDRRRVRLALTKVGKEILHNVMEYAKGGVVRMLADLSAEETSVVSRALIILEEALENRKTPL